MAGNIGNGYIVFDWMVKRLGLTRSETLVYAVLFDAAGGGKRPAVFRLQDIGDMTKLSASTITKALQVLSDEGLIYQVSHDQPFYRYAICKSILKDNHIQYKGSAPELSGVSKVLDRKQAQERKMTRR